MSLKGDAKSLLEMELGGSQGKEGGRAGGKEEEKRSERSGKRFAFAFAQALGSRKGFLRRCHGLGKTI